MHDIKQFGTGGDLIVPTHDVQDLSRFSSSTSYASLLRHSMDSTEIPLSIFHPRIHHEV